LKDLKANLGNVCNNSYMGNGLYDVIVKYAVYPCQTAVVHKLVDGDDDDAKATCKPNKHYKLRSRLHSDFIT